MKIVLLFFFLWANIAAAQVFDVDTLLWNGDLTKRVNLVILGDGYQQSELPQFEIDATNFMNTFFLEPPFLEYKDYFNVFIIKVPSVESGADHPGTATDVTEPAHPVSMVNTYFDAAFDAFGIHRLLVCNNSKVNTVLAVNFPMYDQALVLVNSPHYGGSGGAIAVASTNVSSSQIAIHEIGHSFAGLKDEYYAGDQYASEGINMTQQNNPLQVKWKNWVGDNNIGVNQHCCSGNSFLWYRPHQNCKMRYLTGAFCSVCSEGLVERIHVLSESINTYTPSTSSFTPASYPIDFTLDLTTPSPNTLKRTWNLNQIDIAYNVDSVQLVANDLVAGSNDLTVYIQDTTDKLRIDNHLLLHVESVTWNINNTTISVDQIEGTENKISIDLFPVPTADFVHIKMQDQQGKQAKLELYDVSGKLLTSLEKNISTSPDEVMAISLNAYEGNLFFLKIYVEGTLLTTKKLVKI